MPVCAHTVTDSRLYFWQNSNILNHANLNDWNTLPDVDWALQAHLIYQNFGQKWPKIEDSRKIWVKKRFFIFKWILRHNFSYILWIFKSHHAHTHIFPSRQIHFSNHKKVPKNYQIYSSNLTKKLFSILNSVFRRK